MESLEEAKRQLAQIAAISPGDYFIFNGGEGRVKMSNFARIAATSEMIDSE